MSETVLDLEAIWLARRVNITPHTALRVTYLNTLRAIVGKRSEKNKSGTPMVSDYDLLDATAEEQEEAYNVTLSRVIPVCEPPKGGA